jgi:chaperonin GroES
MNFTPKSGMVLIRPIQHKPASVGLIELADVYHEVPTSGIVLSVAESFCCAECGAHKEPQVDVLDKVIFAPSAGTEFEVNGTRFVLLQESDILAVVNPEVEAEVV